MMPKLGRVQPALRKLGLKTHNFFKVFACNITADVEKRREERRRRQKRLVEGGICVHTALGTWWRSNISGNEDSAGKLTPRYLTCSRQSCSRAKFEFQ